MCACAPSALTGKMVATRRGTRVDPEEEAEGSAGQQAAVESATPASPQRAQRTVQNKPPAEDSGRNSEDQGESTGTTGSPSKNDSRKGPSQVVTRSRNKSGQSDAADVSEAESTTSTSSTRVTRSRQSLGSMTDSARKLRNHRSAVITEPILESKDEELSEAESNCSSVSTRARRIRACASRSTTARSRTSLLAEPVSDHSEAESNCSSVSGLQIAAIRSTRATPKLSMKSESQKEEFSEAESCNSDFVPQTQARRSSRRVQSKPKAGEARSVSETSSQAQESPKKQRYSLRGVKVIEPLSSAQEEEILSTPRRNLRNRIVNECSDVIVLSDSESQSKEFSTKDSHIDESKDEESLKEPQPDLSVEHSSVLEQKLPETSQSANDASNEMIDLTGEEVDEPQLIDQGRPDDDNEEEEEEDDDDDDDVDSVTTDITKKSSPNLNAKTQSERGYAPSNTEKVEISLLLDSDESEKSEDSEEEADIEMEEEENHQDLVKKKRLEQTSIEQSQDAVDSGLFVIDMTPGLDSSKKYYVDHHEDDKESEREQNEEEELSEPHEEEEDFIDEEVDDDDEEEELLTRPKSGFELSTSIDTGMNIKQLGGLYISFDAEKPNPGSSLLKKMNKESKNKDELLKKSVITPDFEKKESVPPYKESLNKLKKLRREEREKTTGQGWFDMKAPEMTEELKNDLKALKMRSAMDPKHFYKKDDREGFPKYFQVGTVIDSPLDHYHSRIPKKQRKRTIVEELLVDSEFRRYNKKKYQEIMAEKAARAEGKKNRKKKKFRT